MPRSEAFERENYQEFKRRFPQVFKGMSLVETLAEMQHFDVDSRLLDATLNPLVALFFACFDEEGTDGPETPGEVIAYFPGRELDHQVEYFDSDRVLLLSALPLLEDTEKHELFVLLKGLSEKCINDDDIRQILRGDKTKPDIGKTFNITKARNAYQKID